MEQAEQKEYYKRFLNKFIKITKSVNKQELYYRGIVKAIFDDQLILDDVKLGEIPISYDGLTILEVREENER